MDHQVVIAGAGPVGLWLAAELRLGGISVAVLEPRLERDPHSKALTIHPRTLEVLASRGVHRPFLDEGMQIPSGHFALLDNRMDFRLLETDFQFTLALPQARTEELLEIHALASGASVFRGHRVAGHSEDVDSVTVRVEGPDGDYDLRAEFLVGCDGTRGTVRSSAGIGFPGTETTVLGWLGDVVLDDPPASQVFSTAGPEGIVMVVPLPGGIHRLVGQDPGDVRTDWPADLTLDDLRAKVAAIAGTDFGMRDPAWLSRFGNASRQAEAYRKGRVLLAGDAAHQHMPTGGVGLNVGVQDAMNLGWKLAATVNGWAPDGLLDTYHDERHPVGADLLESTRAQTALVAAFTPDGQQLRRLMSTLIAERPDFARGLAERLSGLFVSYPPTDPAAHRLTGRRAANLTFAGSARTLFDLLNDGHYVLLDLRADDSTPLPSEPGSPVVARRGRLTGAPADWLPVRAALIRPDGHIGWASEETDDPRLAAGVSRALRNTYRELVC
jgi:2-polyprenyl-6-methoxyphenol hydroxylase-like FAD-dependent oxidoreductase